MDNDILYTEKQLFERAAEGDREVFTQLYKKYAPQLAFFIQGMVKSDCITDEIIQETFMRLWLNREKLATINDPAAWTYHIAANICYRFLKQLFIDGTIKNTVHHENHYSDNQLIETARLYNLTADIRAAVSALAPEQKNVYRLSREKGLKIQDIAHDLSLSPNNVRSILNSSLEFVWDYLKNKGHDIY